MSLEVTAEDRQRFCSRDVLRQIVPDTRGSNRKSLVASRVRQTISDGDDAEQRQRRPSMSGVILMTKLVAHLFKAYKPRELHAALRTA